MNGTGDIPPPLTQNNTTTIDIDFCSLITIIPNLGMSSCRGRAEAFARSLSTKLRTLGTQNNENRLSSEESTSPVINGGAEALLSKEQTTTTNDTWLINDKESNNAQENVLRPLRHDTTTDTTFYDFDCDLESPGSPVDECEYLRLIETTSNTPHNSADDDDHQHQDQDQHQQQQQQQQQQHHYMTNNDVANNEHEDVVDEDTNEIYFDVQQQPQQQQQSPIEAIHNNNNNNNKNIKNNNENIVMDNNDLKDNNFITTTTTTTTTELQRKTTNNNCNNDNDNKVVINGHINDKENVNNDDGTADAAAAANDDEDDEQEITIIENIKMTENNLPLIQTNTTIITTIATEEETTTTIDVNLGENESKNINDNAENFIKTDIKSINNKENTTTITDDLPKLITTNTKTTTTTTTQCGLDTTDDEDECRPQRVRRCSSLKTGKTPPGTPGRKKIVRFADKLGLDLADIKTFLDEIPNIPRSAYEDLEINELDTITTTINLLPKTDKLLVPLFQQPGGLPTFLDIVRERQVALENAAITDPINQTITGYVRVRNLDFHKSVHVRYSLDHWRSYADLQANYIENSCDGFSDKFTFNIYGNSMHIGQRLELAVRFQCKGQQFWDNNYGANYCFQCLPASNNIVNTGTTTSTTTPQSPTITSPTTNLNNTTTTNAYNITTILTQPAYNQQQQLQQQQQHLNNNNNYNNYNNNFNYHQQQFHHHHHHHNNNNNNNNNSLLRVNQCQGQGVIHLQGQMHAIGLCSPTTTVDAWCNSFY